MTSDEVEDVIRGAYAWFNRAERDASGDRELALLDFWHTDGVYVNSADDPDPGIHNGIDAVRGQIGRWVETYPNLRVEPLEIRTNGNVAYVWVRFSGHGAGSGLPIEMEIAHVVTIEDGKTRRLEEYTTRDAGLAAAGLPS